MPESPARPTQAPQVTPEQQEAMSTYVKLWRASHAVELVAHRHLGQYQLTISQFAVLEALYHLGALNQRQLAQKILRSSGNLTMVIDNLERAELVRRTRDAKDRRVMRVSLTDKGTTLLQQILPVHAQGIQQIFSVLTSQELSQLQQLTRKLGLGLQDDTGK